MSLELVLITLNCAKRAQKAADVKTLVREATHRTKGRPGIVVLALEEVAPIMEASFGIVDEYIEPIMSGTEGMLDEIDPGQYRMVATSRSGAVVCLAYVHSSVTIEGEPHTASVSVGYLSSSLKGGAGVRVRLRPDGEADAKDYTFIAAHLAANEGYSHWRNRNMRDILQGLSFGDGFGAYAPGGHVFVLGDLNYRATRSPIARVGDGSPPGGTSQQSDATADEGVQLLQVTDYREVDELYQARAAGEVLTDFDEPEVTFAPTYKFPVGPEVRPGALAYNSKRTPSWCDRVLHGKYAPDSGFAVRAYDGAFFYTSSDHRPVYQSLVVPHGHPPSIPEAVALSPTAALGATTSAAADRAIGWALYLALTRNGNYYLAAGLAATLFFYLTLF